MTKLAFERGTILRPDIEHKLTERIDDGVVVIQDGVIQYVGGYREMMSLAIGGGRPDLGNMLMHVDLDKDAAAPERVILPGFADTHTHTFQPPGIPGVLMENVAAEGDAPVFEGWLPETLKFETLVRQNPERARALAQQGFERYIEEGITASLEYTTSSIDAARIVLEEADMIGLKGRIKVGYVAMDQEVDFIDGVELEVRGEAEQDKVIDDIRQLAKSFPNQVVVIDRFPIAVSSPYRRKLVVLAKELGVLFETHVDESEGEFDIHTGLYNGSRIISVLAEDGVFDPGMKVGLAHGIHTSAEDFARIASAIKNGAQVNVRFCPNSNGQLDSHNWGGKYVQHPFEAWQEAGARITLGTDKGAGTFWNLAQEAMAERARAHEGPGPSEQTLLNMATVNGLASLGIFDDIRSGEQANFIAVQIGDAFHTGMPKGLEALAARTLRAAQRSQAIQSVWVNGNQLKG